MAATQPNNSVAVHFDVADARLRERAIWAFEAVCARIGLREWHIVTTTSGADVIYGEDAEATLRHDPVAWKSRSEPPAAAADALAFVFWWLARVEELETAPDQLDAHGRFAASSAHAVRSGAPLATPVDDVARSVADVIAPERQLAPEPWSIVATHDIDLTWRWTRAGVRRALRALRYSLAAGCVGDACRTLGVLLWAPVWRVRRSDPYQNAASIRRLEWRIGARSTSYVLADARAPEDGDPRMHERGRDRYIKQLVEGRGTRRSADGVVGVHGSYTSALSQGQLARERDYVERVAAGRARDHRFHYLHSLPTRDWPLLAACGFDSDATLGFAEQPGFRAGTAHPYRAWDHESNAPLDLIIIPLAFMDASLDRRYLDLNPHPTRGAGAELARDVIDAVERVDGCASILWHNDRLCVGDQRVWTRLYRALIERVVAHGGRVVSARDAAIAYRMLLPAHRRFEQ